MAAPNPMFSNDNLMKMDYKGLKDLASLCEAIERYEDMLTVCVCLLKKATADDWSDDKDQNGRNMVSVACKNVVGAMRTASRCTKAELKEDGKHKDLITKYHNLLSSRMLKLCTKILRTLAETVCSKLEQDADKIDKLEKDQEKDDSATFWLKMLGDYMRYLTEMAGKEEEVVSVTLKFGDGVETTKKASEWAASFYASATAWAKKLAETDKTRLGLALNYSVFYYEIADKKDEALKLAQDAFDQAIAQLDTLNDVSYKDSTLIMQLLRDNLTLWQQESAPEKEQGQ